MVRYHPEEAFPGRPREALEVFVHGRQSVRPRSLPYGDGQLDALTATHRCHWSYGRQGGPRALTRTGQATLAPMVRTGRGRFRSAV